MATVTFEVISTNRSALADNYRRTFDASGGTIGRAWDNDFVLPDPLCYISSRHARVLFDDGSFYLEDTSTNGVLLEGDKPIGRGSRIDLSTVARLRMGDYLLQVTVSDEGAFAGAGTAIHSLPADDFGDENHFQFDPPANGFREEVVPQDGGLANNGVTAEDVFLHGADEDMLLYAPADLDHAEHPPQGVPMMDDAFFPGDARLKEEPEALLASNPAEEGDSFIPENWNFTGMIPGITPQDLPTPPPAARPVAASLVDELPVETLVETLMETPVETPVERPVETRAEMRAEMRVEMRVERQASPAPPTRPNTTSSPEGANAPAAPRSGGLAEVALRDAGVDPTLLNDPEFVDRWMALLPVVLGGLIDLLQSRAMIKNEMRANKTMLQPVQNNPLKFTLNAADAIQDLFVNNRAGYLPADQAVKEVISDLKLHQVALINGVQGGLNALVNKLSPQAIEYLAAQRPVKKTLLGKVADTTLWGVYKHTYAEMLEHSTDSFLDVFADDFLKAYEKHTMMAKKTRK